MGLPWIQVDKAFLEAQALRLAVALGVPKPHAAGCMAYVWKFCEEIGGDTFEGPDYELLLCEVAQWTGPKVKFVQAIVHADLAEPLKQGVRIRGCDRYEEAKAKDKARRDADKERKRKARAPLKAESVQAVSVGIPEDSARTSAGSPPDSAAQIESKKEIEEKEETLSTSQSTALALTVVEAPTPKAPEELVFEHWRERLRPKAKADKKRLRCVKARLREGRSVEDLCKAVDGCAADPFSQGQNDRHQRYDDLELICRDAAHVEKFMALATGTGPPGIAAPMRRLSPGEDPYAMEAM